MRCIECNNRNIITIHARKLVGERSYYIPFDPTPTGKRIFYLCGDCGAKFYKDYMFEDFKEVK